MRKKRTEEEIVEKPLEEQPLSQNRRLTRTKAKVEEVKSPVIENKPIEGPSQNRRLTRTKAKNEEVKSPEIEDKPVEAEPENRRRTRTKAKLENEASQAPQRMTR